MLCPRPFRAKHASPAKHGIAGGLSCFARIYAMRGMAPVETRPYKKLRPLT